MYKYSGNDTMKTEDDTWESERERERDKSTSNKLVM